MIFEKTKQILPNGAVCGPPLASTVATTTADPMRRFSIAERILWESIADKSGQAAAIQKRTYPTAKGFENHSLKGQLLM